MEGMMISTTSSAPSHPRRRGVVSLSHVKADDGPANFIEAFPVPKRSMAWPGGKITTNKSSAMREFAQRLKEKADRGGKLTAAQLKVLQDYGDVLACKNNENKQQSKRRKPVLGPKVGPGSKPFKKSKFTGRKGGAAKLRKVETKFGSKKRRGKQQRILSKKQSSNKQKSSKSLNDKLASGLSASR